MPMSRRERLFGATYRRPEVEHVEVHEPEPEPAPPKRVAWRLFSRDFVFRNGERLIETTWECSGCGRTIVEVELRPHCPPAPCACSS